MIKRSLGLLAALLFSSAALGAAVPGTPPITYGTPNLNPQINVFGESNIYSYNPAWLPNNAINSPTQIQKWLDGLYVRYINYNTTQDLQGLDRVSCIKAVLPKTRNIFTSSSIIVPPGICTDWHATFVRQGTAGVITNYYNGDPSTQDLANLYQPVIMFTPGSHNLGTIDVIANSNGTDGGSGIVTGRTWAISGLAIANGGSGFVGGETCTTKNGDTQAPYKGAKFTISSASGGAATGITYAGTRWGTDSGYYSFPLLLQQQIWTAANGWTGTRQVFDGSGNYLTTCSGSGSGLTVTATPQTDWVVGSTLYQGYFDNNYMPTYSYLGTLKVSQSRDTTDATYGSTIGVLMSAFDQRGQAIYSQLAHNGTIITGSDVFFDQLNSISDGTGLYLKSVANVNIPNVVLDNDTTEYLKVDNSFEDTLKGAIFTDTGTTPTVTPYSIGLSDTGGSIASENLNLNFDFVLYNAGNTSTPIPALNCQYTIGSNFHLVVSNVYHNNAVFASQNNALVNFGTDCQGSNNFSGTIDNLTGPVYTGSPPTNINWNILDPSFPIQPGTNTLTVGGTVTTSDVIGISFANPRIASLPVTASYTAAGGDTTTTIATGLAAAINANSTLQGANIIATSSGAVVTTSEAGYWTRLSALTYAQGGNTETVTISNSGVPSGMTNGAMSTGPGIYSGYSPSAPAAQTGIGKAGAGSIMVNTSNGTSYNQGGSLSVPSWLRAVKSNSASGVSINIDNVLAGAETGTAARICTLGEPCLLGVLRGANLNVTTDQSITIGPLSSASSTYLSTATKYLVTGMWLMNCSTSVTTAAGGLYSAASKAGAPLVAATQTYTGCTSATTMQTATIASGGLSTTLTGGFAFFSLTTPQGSAATGDVYVYGIPLN